MQKNLYNFMSVLRNIIISIGVCSCIFVYGDVVYTKNSPQIANYYLNDLKTDASFISDMARYDVLILTPAQIASRQSVINQIVQKNRDIIILAYIPSQSYNYKYWTTDVIFRHMNDIEDEWWLRDSDSNRVSVWDGLYTINMDPAWSRYLTDFINQRILSLPQVDGVFFDMVSHNISWANKGDIDMDNNGVKDTVAFADQLWLERTEYLLSYAQEHLETDYMVINGSSHEAFQPYVNGRMFETFPTPWEGDGQWETIMNHAVDTKKQHTKPYMIIFNSNTNNTGDRYDYKHMRFGLTSSLLEDDVYFSFDYGDENHGQTWWYDEYNIDLGNSISSAQSSQKYSSYEKDIWQRQFEQGISVVNSTHEKQTISLGGEYEKIHGVQDVETNDGSIVSEVTVPGEDGIILLKTFDIMYDVLFTNGAFSRFFRPDGSRVRNGFFVFDEEYRGGYQIAYMDFDDNGRRELLVVRRNRIEMWRDDGVKYLRIWPFTANYKGTLQVAIGDVDEDLKLEIYVAPSEGIKGPIKSYNRYGRQIKDDFYPFGKDYDGGYSLAVGDVDGGLNTELVVGTSGKHTNVFVFDKNFELKYQWRPFESWFLGGARVAIGDVVGDYREEIIVGRGPGGKPEIGVFDAFGNALYNRFSAYDTISNPGIDVRVLDVDFDGMDDIIGMSESGF